MVPGAEDELLVRVLGRIEVRAAPWCAWVEPPPQQRTILGLLVAHLGRPCEFDQLVDAVWGDDAPPNAHRLLQGLIYRLRRVLQPDRDETPKLRALSRGWQLALDPDAVDVARLERLARAASERLTEGDADRARQALEEAAGLARGRPFAELADHPCLVAEVVRLEEQQLAVRERLLEVRLDAGEHAEAVAELQQLAAAHPLRERLWGLLLQALYRAGRHADALGAYEQLRTRLADELGADPGPELQRLHTAILRHEPPAAAAAPSDRAAAPQGGHRGPRTPVRWWPCRRDLPLAGREHELSVLDGALERARCGQRQVVLVCGEPGVGKSRLAAEVADRAGERGADVLVGRCAEGASVPYQPFVEALRADVDATSDEQLHARLGRNAGELARLLPEIASRTGQQVPAASVNPDLDQHRLFEAVTAWLEAASMDAPLLLVLEDLHAATRPTLRLLCHLAQATANAPLVVLATYRDTHDETTSELVDALAALARLPEVSPLALAGLAADAVSQLVEGSVDADERTRQRLAAQLHWATSGNALFVQELLAGLQSDRIPDSVRLEGSALPWSLQQLFEARLQRLAPATVAFLEQAAIAGEQFDFEAVAQAASLTDDTALAALDEAAGARLVVPAGGHGDRYAFAHALMRAALLGRLTPSRRTRRHARLAAALERRHAGDLTPVVADLAHHYAQAGPAGDPMTARRYAQAAGDVAMNQFAYEEAAAQYKRALDLIDDTDEETCCDLLTALGHAQQRAGPGVHSTTLHKALHLATELGDAERIARAAWVGNRGFPRHLFSVDDERVAVLQRAADVVGEDMPGPRATLLAVLAGELTFASDRNRPRQLSDQALALARHADGTVLARVLALRQFTIHDPTTVAERLANTAELLPLADRLDDPSLQVFARWWRAIAALQAGQRPDVDTCVDEACQLADELGELFTECASLMLAATRELAWGDLDEAANLAERYRALGQQADAHHITGPYTGQLLLIHRERGDLAEALPRLEDLRAAFTHLPHAQALLAPMWWEVGRHDEARAVLEDFKADGLEDVAMHMMWLHIMCWLADVAVAAGDHAAARTLRRQLSPYAGQMVADAGVFDGSVDHRLGLLETTLGNWTQAEQHLHKAAHAHTRLGAHRWTNRTHLAQAQLLLTRDEPSDRTRANELLKRTADAAHRHGQTALARTCAHLSSDTPLDAPPTARTGP